MFEKLNEKDKKTMKIGGIAAIAILVLVFGYQGYNDWTQKKSEYESLMISINSIELTDSARANLLKAVPIFQMPKGQETQKSDFRNFLGQQFDELRITTSPWLEIPEKASSNSLDGYSLLSLNSKGTCRFDQILDLLASLKYNPYLAGIEELHIECDPQDPQQATFSITLSTYTKKRGNNES